MASSLFALFFAVVVIAFILLVLIAVASDITAVFSNLLSQLTTNTSAPGYTTAKVTVSLTNTFFIIIFITFIAIVAIIIIYRRHVH